MMSNNELKAIARGNLEGNWGLAIAVLVVTSVIETACGTIAPGVGAMVIMGPLNVGYAWIFLELNRGRIPEFTELFSGFNNFVNTFIAGLLVNLFTALWSMLFVVPGIIKAISYSQTYNLLNDHPELSGMEAIQESKRMMEGHKMEYFMLHLSFLPWFLACIFVVPIFYVAPYVSAAQAAFYDELKNGGTYFTYDYE